MVPTPALAAAEAIGLTHRVIRRGVASTGMRFLDPFTGVSSPVQRLAGFV